MFTQESTILLLTVKTQTIESCSSPFRISNKSDFFMHLIPILMDRLDPRWDIMLSEFLEAKLPEACVGIRLETLMLSWVAIAPEIDKPGIV